LDYQDVIDTYTGIREHRHLELDDKDWKCLRLVSDWLKAFREATTNMSTTSTPMLSYVHITFRVLQKQIKQDLRKLPNDVPPEIKQGLVDANQKLAEYYAKYDESYFYTWASCE
ncbi:hypothetical protein K525DRAFT_213894, partial [Schizophyllum commune Loenen D]